MGYVKDKLKKLFLSEHSPHVFALSCALGTFVAFSPYLGIQTVLVMVLAWIMRLNIPVAVTVTYIVNNPWTMIPIVVLNYMVGSWIARCLLCINLKAYEPAFMQSVVYWLDKKIGRYLSSYLDVHDLSFWAYVIGGNVVGLLMALLAYPLALVLFKRYARSLRKHQP